MNLSQYTKEFSANIRLAYPVILGMLGHTMIGVVDNYMVGSLGSTELAAVSLGNSFVFLALSLGIGFSTAITPLVAEAHAERNTDKIRATFHHGLFLCTILGLVLFVLTILSKHLIYLMDQPAEVVALAGPYIDWIAFSLLPLVVYQGYKQFSDGLSQTKYAMYAIFLAVVLNIFFNYLLIHGIWIFPKLGIIGAALGTVISRVIMVIFMHYIMKHNAIMQEFFTGFSFSSIKKSILQKIINLGVPSSMQMMFEVTLFTAAIWLSGTLGKNNQAANQIALTLASSTFMVAMGLNVTAMIRVGNAKGMADFKGLIVVARSIFILTILLETVFAFLFIVFHQYLPYLFLNTDDVTQAIDNQEIVMITAKLLIVAAFFQISDGVQVVVLGALRGLQDVKIPMYITFVAYWVVGFPISIYLGKYTELGAVGIWIGLLAGLTAAAVFLYIRFARLTKKLVVLEMLK